MTYNNKTQQKKQKKTAHKKPILHGTKSIKNFIQLQTNQMASKSKLKKRFYFFPVAAFHFFSKLVNNLSTRFLAF